MLQRNSAPVNASRASSKFNSFLGMLMVSLALSGSIASPVIALDLIEALFGSSTVKPAEANACQHAQPTPDHDAAQHKSVLRVMAAVEKPAAINDSTLQIEQ